MGAGGSEAGPQLNLAGKPDILFRVFGERDDPRMIPLAVLEGSTLKPIVLDATGWRTFDSLYARQGASYSLYQRGQAVGSVRVRQGMWQVEGRPLYSLPNCDVLTPLAAVVIEGNVKAEFTVELLAATRLLAAADRGEALRAAQVDDIARTIGHAAGQSAGVSPATLGALAFRGAALATGAADAPTIVSTAIEQGGAAGATQVFVIADRTGTDYAPTFTHTTSAAAGTPEYRRLIDHVDLTGDGVDEIVLEGWRTGGDTFLSILGFRGGQWTEIFRSRSNWCLDEGR